MNDIELHYLELTQVAHLLQTRKISPVELTQAMLHRIESLDRNLHAYALLNTGARPRAARRAEKEIANRVYRGPLHGVPIGLKDLCHTKGIPTAAGMPIHRDFKPAQDGTVVKRLYDAGAVCLGKLQLTEGAFADHHPSITPPVNPWNADHWSGASSSGSGVAAAAGLAFATLGSDTGGSIRFPSAACGNTGLKPTWGRVSRYGAFELAASLDHLGPMCRSAADAGCVLQIIAGADADDPTASQAPVPDYLRESDRDLRNVRIGLDERYAFDGVDRAMTQTVREALTVLRALGAEIKPVQFPDCTQILQDWAANCAVETAVAHEPTYPSRKSEYGPGLAGLIESGRSVTVAEYQKILLRRVTSPAVSRRCWEHRSAGHSGAVHRIAHGQTDGHVGARSGRVAVFDAIHVSVRHVGQPHHHVALRLHRCRDADRISARIAAHGGAIAGTRGPGLSTRDALAPRHPKM
jgi:amidase